MLIISKTRIRMKANNNRRKKRSRVREARRSSKRAIPVSRGKHINIKSNLTKYTLTASKRS